MTTELDTISNEPLGSLSELAQALILIADEMDDKDRTQLRAAWELAYNEIEGWAGPDSTDAHVRRMAYLLTNFGKLGSFLDAIVPSGPNPLIQTALDSVDSLLADL